MAEYTSPKCSSFGGAHQGRERAQVNCLDPTGAPAKQRESLWASSHRPVASNRPRALTVRGSSTLCSAAPQILDIPMVGPPTSGEIRRGPDRPRMPPPRRTHPAQPDVPSGRTSFRWTHRAERPTCPGRAFTVIWQVDGWAQKKAKGPNGSHFW